MSTLPAAFIGHGNPMNALETNRFTDAWAALGRAVGTPRAVLAISAHWYIAATAVTAWRGRAPSTTSSASPRRSSSSSTRPRAPRTRRGGGDGRSTRLGRRGPRQLGLDHGTWSVLTHMFPDANVPVVQLSVNAAQPLEYHVGLGRKLAPSESRASSSWRAAMWFTTCGGWTSRSKARLRLGRAVRRGGHRRHDLGPFVARLARRPPDYALAVPTPDHYLPAATWPGSPRLQVSPVPCWPRAVSSVASR